MLYSYLDVLERCSRTAGTGTVRTPPVGATNPKAVQGSTAARSPADIDHPTADHMFVNCSNIDPLVSSKSEHAEPTYG